MTQVAPVEMIEGVVEDHDVYNVVNLDRWKTVQMASEK